MPRKTIDTVFHFQINFVNVALYVNRVHRAHCKQWRSWYMDVRGTRTTSGELWVTGSLTCAITQGQLN